MKKKNVMPDLLFPALRQYCHNNGDGLLPGYDKKETEKIVSGLIAKIEELQDFAIWMTGCGYDFCQHEYFCTQRDKLLKDT